MIQRDLASLALRAGVLTLSIGLAASVVHTAHERANRPGGDPNAATEVAADSFLLSSKSGVIVFEEMGPARIGGAGPLSTAPTFLPSSKSLVIGPLGPDSPIQLGEPDPTFFSSSKVLAPADVTPMIELLSMERATVFQSLGAQN